jgi:NAD(P)H dehydrogenase (quinone)
MRRDSGRRARIVVPWSLLALGPCTMCWLGVAPVTLAGSRAQDQLPAARIESASQPPVTVLVVYYSLTGNTEKMARAVADGARQVPSTKVVTRKANEVSADDLKNADGIVLGSPTYWGNMAGPMKSFIDDWWLKYKVPLSDKVGGSFASGGGDTGGKENVIYSLNIAMMNAGMILVGPLEAGFGLPGVSALDPVNDKALKESRALGDRVATVARRVKATSLPKLQPAR